MREEGVVPVWPGRADHGHEEWGAGGEEEGTEDKVEGWDAVDQEAREHLHETADDQRRENSDGGLEAGEVLDFLETVLIRCQYKFPDWYMWELQEDGLLENAELFHRVGYSV